MIVPRAKIEAAADQEGRYPTLKCVYLRGKFLEATDSYMFGKVPVERQKGDRNGAIPLEALAEARRLGGDLVLDNGTAQIKANDRTVSFDRPRAKKFPAYNTLSKKHEEPPVGTVRLNVQLLARAAKALGVDHVEIEIVEPNKPVRIRPLPTTIYDKSGRTVVRDGAEALLMPIRTPEPPA